MHIAINTLPLSGDHTYRGTGVYTKNLIDALLQFEKGNTYSFFTQSKDIPDTTDLTHYPFFDPFFLSLPLFRNFKTVVTVHDVIPLVFPDKFPPGFRGQVKWQVQRLSLLRSQAVITDSNRSKDDIERLIGFSSKRVHVVPLSPTEQYKPINDLKIVKRVRQGYNLPESFVLYVGDINWNKNIPGLLHVWKNVIGKNSKKRNYKLVLAGSAFLNIDLKETKEMQQIIDHLGLKNDVQCPGFIESDDMPGLYGLAECVVLPSWYEGFGLPILEAMACGVPVVASDKGSIPEISGPSKLFNPMHETDMAHAILDTINLSRGERQKIIAKGLLWVKQYSWKRVAHETVAVYRSVYEDKHI